MNKTSAVYEYLFPCICKVERAFDTSHDLFMGLCQERLDQMVIEVSSNFVFCDSMIHFEKPLIYTVKEHRSSVKGLAASHIKANTTNRLQLESSFSFSMNPEHRVPNKAESQRLSHTHLPPIIKKANCKCLTTSAGVGR